MFSDRKLNFKEPAVFRKPDYFASGIIGLNNRRTLSTSSYKFGAYLCFMCIGIVWAFILGNVIWGNKASTFISGNRSNVSLEDAVCTTCLVCSDYYTYQVLFNNCTHFVCQSCYDNDSLKVCPICKTTKGPKPGRLININCSKYSLRQEVLDDYGVTQAMVQASKVSLDILGRRPGDLDDQDFAERLRHGNRQSTSASSLGFSGSLSSRPTASSTSASGTPALARTTRFRLVMPVPEYDSEDDFII